MAGHINRQKKLALYTLLEQGKTVEQIAALLELHSSTVYRWKAKWVKQEKLK